VAAFFLFPTAKFPLCGVKSFPPFSVVSFAPLVKQGSDLRFGFGLFHSFWFAFTAGLRRGFFLGHSHPPLSGVASPLCERCQENSFAPPTCYFNPTNFLPSFFHTLTTQSFCRALVLRLASHFYVPCLDYLSVCSSTLSGLTGPVPFSKFGGMPSLRPSFGFCPPR